MHRIGVDVRALAHYPALCSTLAHIRLGARCVGDVQRRIGRAAPAEPTLPLAFVGALVGAQSQERSMSKQYRAIRFVVGASYDASMPGVSVVI